MKLLRPGRGDAGLVRRARSGDVDAFAALVQRNQDRIYRLALRMVGPDAAEDVAQQAFVKAWQGLGSFDGASSFGTWVYRIAINQCLDHLRRTARFRPQPLDQAEAAEPGGDDPADEVADRAERAERHAALAWAIEQLPSQERLLLYLRTVEERSYEEISELLEMNPRTVGTRLFRARARLHDLITRRLQEDHHAVR